MKFLTILTTILLTATSQAQPFRDSTLPIDERVESLLKELTTQEKISMMVHTSPAIDRLGIPAYNWWNEALHGVARSSYKTTVFPQAIALAATFNAPALQQTATMISDEARAIYHKELREKGGNSQYHGLTFWTPNINIFRDPRWGRGQETYGEDPFLSGLMGSAMVAGLEGDDARYLKSSACAKHFAVHSGPEHNRHSFNAKVSEYDLWDTYLPAFRTLVKEAGVSSVMCAYNRLDGEPCCASNKLLRQILINNWGFAGYVVSDCWAVKDFYNDHKTHPDSPSSAAEAVLHGTDLECGNDYGSLMAALERGLITSEQIDIAVRRILTIKMRLGMFDNQDEIPYSKIPISVVECDKHKAQAQLMARQSMVLLKNSKLLPLKPTRIKRIALVGPNIDNGEAQLGNYNGYPTINTTVLDALRSEEGVEIIEAKGCEFTTKIPSFDLQAYLKQIKDVDLILFVGGISARLEGEAGDAGNDMVEGFAGGDRSSIHLPSVQTDLMRELRKSGKPLIFVNMSGSAMAFNWEAESADAVIQAWYGGQAAGNAIVDLIFGRYNPSGRLPVTFYKSESDLPDFEDYSMARRTYRYFDGEVLYPFGYGLSFSKIEYGKLQLPDSVITTDNLTVSVEVRNSGRMEVDEVVQLYVSHRPAIDPAPIAALKGVKRVTLKAGESQRVEFVLSPQEMAYIDKNGSWTLASGHSMQVMVGGRSPHADAAKFGPRPLQGSVEITGKELFFER